MPDELTVAETGTAFRITPAQMRAFLEAHNARVEKLKKLQRLGDPLPTYRQAIRASRIVRGWGVVSVETECRLALKFARAGRGVMAPRPVANCRQPRGRRAGRRSRARSPGRPRRSDDPLGVARIGGCRGVEAS